jgi:hypothetical protein
MLRLLRDGSDELWMLQWNTMAEQGHPDRGGVRLNPVDRRGRQISPAVSTPPKRSGDVLYATLNGYSSILLSQQVCSKRRQRQSRAP